MSWGRYILRRLASTFAVLLAVVLLTFWLSRYASDDPVYAYLAATDDLEQASITADLRTYRSAAHTLGQDLPPFFVSLQPSHYPDTLHRLIPLSRKLQAKALLKHGLAWNKIQTFQSELWQGSDEYRKALRNITRIQTFRRVQNAYQQGPFIDLAASQQRVAWPSLHWNGMQNSFWHFAGGMLRGDFGYSLQTGEAVATRIGRAFRTTFPIALLALVLSVVLGTWLGTFIAQRNDVWLKRSCYVILSLPGVLDCLVCNDTTFWSWQAVPRSRLDT